MAPSSDSPDSPDSLAALVTEAEPLYGLPLAEFTPARDALAKSLRATDRELADRVKVLRKPSVAAWVVNLLVRREPEQVAQLVAVGSALRDAAAALDADQLREFTKQRRQLTAAVTTIARRHALAEGQKVTESVAEEVEGSLTAAMLDAAAAEAVRSGLLVRALTTTGLGDLDPTAYLAAPEALGHVASSAPTVLHVVPDPGVGERRREAKQAAARAEKELRIARDAHARAKTGHQGAQAQALQVESEIDEARRRLAELEEREEKIAAQVERSEIALEAAAEEVRAAEAARDAAVAELDAR